MQPPKTIVDILDAPPPPTVNAGPSRDIVLVVESPSMPSIAELSRPMLRLAGVRIDPTTNGPHPRPRTVGLLLKHLDTGSERRIAVPRGAAGMPLDLPLELPLYPDWSRCRSQPDGQP